MSGYLARLAARAAGTAVALRADAVVPGAGDGRSGAAPEAGGFPATALAHPVMQQMVAEAPAPDAGPGPATPTPPADLRPPAMPVNTMWREAAQAYAPGADHHEDALASLLPTTAPAILAGTPLAVRSVPPVPAALSAAPADRQADAGHAEVSAVPPVPLRAAIGVATATAAAGPASPPVSAPGTPDYPGAEPAPLMARGPHPPPLAPAPPRAPVPVPAAPAATADTEVHIHIGRIDVTAVPEAAAPRRSAAPVQAPMSLDAYLAQRGRT